MGAARGPGTGSLPAMSGRVLRLIFVAAAFALALVVLGCGEKSEPATTGPVVQTTSTTIEPGTGDKDLVEAAATAFLVSPGPLVCDEGITPKLLNSEYKYRAGCIKARKPDEVATNAAFGGINVGNGTATAAAKATGGTYGKGERVTMTLVRSGQGAWLVDTVKPSQK